MSERPTTNVRYLRTRSLDQEQALYANYYKDLIENYGIEATYFRHETKFPNSLDLTASGLGVENLIYGENTDPNYYLSGDMDIYIEVENDVFEMDKYGITPNENITIYFSVGDFNSRYASRLGGQRLFSTTQTITGSFSNSPTAGSYTFTTPFVASSRVPDSTSTNYASSVATLPGSSTITINNGRGWKTGTSGIPVGVVQSGASVQFIDFPILRVASGTGYKLPINPYIAEEKYYSVVSGSDFTGSQFGNLNFTSAGSVVTFSGTLSTDINYYDPSSTSKYEYNITPQVGDFFRMQFFDENQEEFEITQITDDNLLSDGINPLLGVYVWKCQAVRRIPSHEDVTGEQPTESEMFNDEIQNIQSTAIEKIADTIHDYTTGEDLIYGGYESDDSPFTASTLTPSSTQFAGKIFAFEQGPSYLYTDSINLYYQNQSGNISNITQDSATSDFGVPDKFVNIKMLKSDGEDLYFVNTNNGSYKLTDSYKENPHVNTMLNLQSPYFSKSHPSSGMYMTLDKGLFLYSDGDNLFCINEDLESTQIV